MPLGAILFRGKAYSRGMPNQLSRRLGFSATLFQVGYTLRRSFVPYKAVP